MDARRFILSITTMKPNVPSTNMVYNRRLTGFPEIALQLKLLFICATSVFAFLNSTARALEPGKIWVASWTSSPQGPDVLSRRLHGAYGNKIAVVKEAISGNTVTTCPREGGTSVNGPSAADRLDRDVSGVAGLRYVVWLEGINDLGACLVSADQVIQAYKDVVDRLHAKKIKVIGATLVSSFGIPIASYGFPKKDVERKKINTFIRTGGPL